MTNYQQREAKRLGLNRAIETAEDSEYQRRMRAVREENARRVLLAQTKRGQ